MRHLGQVGNHHLAENILAQSHRQLTAGFLEGGVFDDLFQVDGFAVFVGDFDTDHAASGDRCDNPDRDRLQGHRQVILQVGNFVDLDAGSRSKLVHGHHRTRFDFDHIPLNAEVEQLVFEHLCRFGQALLVDRLGFTALMVEQ